MLEAKEYIIMKGSLETYTSSHLKHTMFWTTPEKISSFEE